MAVKTGFIFLCLVLAVIRVAAEPLTVEVRGHRVKTELFSIFANPGESITLGLLLYDKAKIQAYLDGVAYGHAVGSGWRLVAPEEPGLYKLQLAHLETHARSTFNLFVGVSRNKMSGEFLNQYRIGPPPPGNSKHPGKYIAPAAFIEVTEENRKTRLSEHFTLEQFLCKQKSGYPKYVVLREPLLVLLEGLIAEVRASGYPVDTFGIISGYRTPYYNASIGNVENSRHVYGDALDFFIDLDGNGRMDDLDGNGQLDRGDVEQLLEIVVQYKEKTENQVLVGGVGRYKPTSQHGGFIHVDTRGYRARW